MIYLNCGHTDSIRPFGWPLTVKEYGCGVVDGYHKQVAHYSYCRDCYVQALLSYPELLILNDYEVEKYFGQT